MIGRRVATIEEIVEPGDYCGPLFGYTGDKEACFFLLPNADTARRAAQEPGSAPWHSEDHVHHVAFPPHTYRECPDGSLEIRASIGALGMASGDPYVWHGFLDEGHVWRTC
jgi:hypothetical protein